jgi:hypothetical protein
MHYARQYRYGRVTLVRAPQGSGSITRDGYVLLPGGMREHRAVMERLLGRKLTKGEVVHHIDGDRLNNTPENLELLPSQAVHRKLHTGRPATCTAPGCNRIHYARALCERHYAQARRSGVTILMARPIRCPHLDDPLVPAPR